MNLQLIHLLVNYGETAERAAAKSGTNLVLLRKMDSLADRILALTPEDQKEEVAEALRQH